MNKNMGPADRKLRLFLLAPLLVAAGVLVGPTGWVALVLYVLAAVMVATSAAGSCPLYSMFGFRTCPLPQSRTSDGTHPVSR